MGYLGFSLEKRQHLSPFGKRLVRAHARTTHNEVYCAYFLDLLGLATGVCDFSYFNLRTITIIVRSLLILVCAGSATLGVHGVQAAYEASAVGWLPRRCWAPA